MIRITRVDNTRTSFANSFRKVSDEIAESALEAIADLVVYPMPKRLRFHKLRDYKNPSIYTIDATTNHSHKISLEVVGNIAVLRRIGTHKEIDNAP